MTDSTSRAERTDLAVLARHAMLQRGLEPDFPAAALDQAERLPGPARDNAIADQSNLLWCSIDNEDSRDLDQLTVCERLSGGSVRIHVAVADVDALVAKGTPVDEHARRNTTVRLHARANIPHASGAVVDGPDVAQSSGGPAGHCHLLCSRR